MIRAAGLGIAYHGKAVLKAATPHHIDHSPLHALTLITNTPHNASCELSLYGKVRVEDLPVHHGYPKLCELVDILKD